MENFLNNYSNMEDDISVSSTDDEERDNLIDLINNHPDIPLDFEEMEDYIEDMVELYELQYRGRPNESGDPPNALVIRHLVEQERNVLLDLADDGNDVQNQFQNLPMEYHPTANDGDMPQYFLEEEDIQIVNTVNILVAKKVRPVKTRYKTTKRASIDNLRYLENENEEPLHVEEFVIDVEEFVFDVEEFFNVDPLHHRHIRIDLRNLAERPNEAGDRMIPLNLMEEDNDVFNMLHFDFSFADAATNSGDMPQDFLKEEEIEGLTIKKNVSKKKEKQCKRRSRTTICTSSDNFRIPIKNSFRSKSCLRKRLLTYSAQSDVHIRRNDHQ